MRGPATLLIMLLAAWSGRASAQQTPSGGFPPITEAARLRALTPEETRAGPPVQLTGTVIYYRDTSFPDLILQDHTGGVFAEIRPSGFKAGDFTPGQQITIEGRASLGGVPSPSIIGEKITAGPFTGLPLPDARSPQEILRGAGQLTRVEFTGVIRAARVDPVLKPPRLVLEFGSPQNRLTVWLARPDSRAVTSLVPDTKVTIRGVPVAFVAPNLQRYATAVVVHEPGDITITSPPPEIPPPAPLAALLSSHPDEFDARRQLVDGVVTLNWPGERLVIQQDATAINIHTATPLKLKAGDHVELSGFPGTEEGRVVIQDPLPGAVMEGSLPIAERLHSPREIFKLTGIGRDATRITLTARLQEIHAREQHPALHLEADGISFKAILPGGITLPKNLDEGAELRLTGICHLLLNRSPRLDIGPIEGFEIQLADLSGITVITPAPWWTAARVTAVLAVVLIVLALSLLWVIILRRKVEERGRLLAEEIRAGHDARLVVSERQRLASDLHDTLSQTLSGASFQLEVAESTGDLSKTGTHLHLARVLLDRGREELRRTVWDLTPCSLVGADPDTALREIAAELAAYNDCEIIIKRDGDLSTMPDRVRSHLFRIGQEAVYNAVRHGSPDNIDVLFRATGDGYTLEVADDGCGFEPSSAPGPSKGHFGLNSMRNRTLRLSGTFAITSNPTTGTRLSVAIPVHLPEAPAIEIFDHETENPAAAH